MSAMASINPRIVEALYIEALVLSDAARAGFEQWRESAGDQDDAKCEALRTTTRLMHCLAWLLNHRAWFAGQISAVQLRRHGKLIRHIAPSDAAVVARLPHDLRDLVEQSEQLYARIERLEAAWQGTSPGARAAIERLTRQSHGPQSKSCAAQP